MSVYRKQRWRAGKGSLPVCTSLRLRWRVRVVLEKIGIAAGEVEARQENCKLKSCLGNFVTKQDPISKFKMQKG